MAVDVQLVRRQLERVLSSSSFIRSERMSRLLRFVVERHLDGRDDALKESVIALEVFGNRDYDPKQDSIVRTEIARLRARLAEYYLREGAHDQVLIELPKGRYIPVFQPNELRVEPRNGYRRFWFMGALMGLAIALAAIGWWTQRKNTAVSIAVLPLENLNHDSASDYFSDGLTDELIRNLSIIDGLEVRSHTSSFAFKGRARDLREVGKELRADYILEGSVLRADPDFRINTRLVRVRDDVPVWSGRYDQNLTKVLAIQDEISRGIVNELRLTLGRGRRRYETSVEAYDLYLRARTVRDSNVALQYSEWTSHSIGLFEQAIAKDPSFAPAYAGLATARAFQSGLPDSDRTDELAKMINAARKAIELDPLLAEAHDALGTAYARDGQWAHSEKSFRRALELDRNRALSYEDFVLYLLLPLGRIEEGLRQLRIAEKNDPLSPQVQSDLALVLLSAARYDEASTHCEQLPAGYYSKNECRGRARLGQGRTSEAIQILATADFSRARAYLGHAYARAGRRDEAEKLAASLAPNPFQEALIYAGLGDKERTLEALQRMTALGPARVGRALTYPEFALLRGDGRLKDIRKKVGLP